MSDIPKSRQPTVVKVPCAECGGGCRAHDIVAQHDEDLGNEEYREWGGYQICRCRGCGTIRFREVLFGEDDYDFSTGEMRERIRVFPIEHGAHRKAIDAAPFPDSVERMYVESVHALNAGAHVLAAGGLRATVEALCQERAVHGANLDQKIDSLVSKELLAKPQADLLHEARLLGNQALHELVPPDREDLEAGLEIIETLLKTIYVLPAKAAAMRDRRNKTGKRSAE